MRVTQRTDQLLAVGEMEGRAVWLRILSAIEELLPSQPSGLAH